ncbi:TonB-dependent receptor plug domain-containing protein [Teredinibacter haidensis]|uniref:TonB-dependent receptor plug domain-containing protein n=1 Tax=Teredinibacter haidensis TaxID=2731755 RepID=UPI000948EA56|nr:TonB-dependent receptor [Teredinibacter haidensis]
MRKLLFVAALASCSQPLFADSKDDALVEEMTVTGVRERLYQKGMLKDVIQKTEVISSVSIEKANATNLTEAIGEAPGVRVNNECSMCGVKRVMLNGLRGEHTTILVDGIPTYTMMSGFYGLDAAATVGLQRIEVARGAGASLIAPEAIGGTINLVTKVAQDNGAELNLVGGNNGYRQVSGVATLVANDESTRITALGQYDNRDLYDGDDNGVGESPDLENRSLTLFVSQDFGYSNNIQLRVNNTQSEIFGGPAGKNIDDVKADYFSDPDWQSSSLFLSDDVRNRYIGRSWETAEWIESERNELYLSWVHEFNADLNITLSASRNQHTQDSFYEGFFYSADNGMTYGDVRANLALNDEHLLTFGVDTRVEELKSESNSDSPDYISDSFDYDTRGFYLQDTWTVTENFEISSALRFDNVVADFVDPQKPGKEIDESLLSPRMDMRFTHNDQWTSRFSAGRGYRAPLSFFESDHGILDGELGFDIQISQLERSETFSYALSFEGNKFSATSSLAQTELDNLASLGTNAMGVPVLSQMQETAKAWVADVALNYAVSEQINIAATAENILYNHHFKNAYGVVPVEKRLVLSLDWDINGWDIFASSSWVGSRNLSQYGTPEHPTFDLAGNDIKQQVADAYWTVDIRVSKELGDHWQFAIGATNLFDYTQVEDMETPLFYDAGSYDVAHIYGPLRGREAYAGVKYVF